MPETTVCAICGADIQPAKGRGRPRKFCQDCTPVARRLSRAMAFFCSVCGKRCHGETCQECTADSQRCRRTYLSDIECGVCAAQLTTEQVARGGEYCGRECANRAAGLARGGKQHGKSRRPCKWCGQEFKPTHSQPNRPQRFCSTRCRGEWQQAQNPKSSRVYPHQCDDCGEWFIARSPKTKFCSRECGYAAWYAKAYQKQPCREVDCRRCGKPFVQSRSKQAYCSKRCNQAAARDRRTARKRKAYVADVWRAKIYERDGFRCRLCGKRLAMKQEAPHPKSPTIDHIIPLSLGGTHEPANVQSAHFICNSIKGNRGGGEQLMLVG